MRSVPTVRGAPVAAEGSVRRASFAQERFWFLDQMDPGSPVLNEPMAFRLTGRLDAAALKRALQDLVNRHEALRTTLEVRDGHLFQVIAPALTVDLPTVDLAGRPEHERQAEARRRAADETRRPFDLARGPLLRAMLLRLGEEEHVLSVTMHHTVCDGWSMEVLTRELSTLYNAFTAGRPSPLSPPALQYADFAERQRRSLEGGALDAHRAYWRQALGGDLPALPLPTDRPRPPVQTSRGAEQSLTLSRGLSQALSALSRREGVTLFMTLLAAFQTLLHRYTGQDHIAVGAPVAERDLEEHEDVIGCFLNVLILRTEVAGDPTFRELLARVRAVVLQAYHHHAMPFQKLVEDLRPDRDPSRAPLVQVFLNMLSFPRHELALAGLSVERLHAPKAASMYEVTLYVVEREAGIGLRVVYNPDLFDADTIARMLGHLRTLLEAVAADAGQRLSTLPLLTECERHQLLVEWNDTEAPYPADLCVHQLVERQVARTPDGIAAVLDDAQMTYRELNCRANRLARRLRALGVGPETRVGICLERSFEMVIALLAALKAGGAYVPLDPAYPRARLAFLLDDARPAVLLTQKRLVSRLPAWAGPLVCVDGAGRPWEGEQATDLAVSVGPANLAYVIYTSGSTGQPKGCLVPHRGAVSYLTFLANTYGLGPADVVLQLCSISFDPSVRDIFGALATGARIALLRDPDSSDPPAVLAGIRKHRVTRIVAIVPAMLRPLLAAAEREGLALESIRTILVSGEPLHMVDVARTRKILSPDALIVNHYGPTEITMTATCHAVGPADAGRNIAPAGRPIDNVRLYILDRYLNPVPIGVPGEVHIGGVGVARGYLHRPRLTAEKFIPNPFHREPGARLYRTGDVGRYLPDGTMELLGRADNQVKVRGIRVELGEVEAALREHPAVREAAVILSEDDPDDARLVAYLAAEPARAPRAGELRRFLEERLPGYMVPADFVILEALPLTPNRKVDRRALPRLDRAAAERGRAFVAPRTIVEEALARLWAETLRQGRVGVHDNFFELGGHSLLAGRLLARVRDRFRVDLSLRAFLAAPTVASLATAIVQRLAEGAQAEAMMRTLDELRGLADEDARRMLRDA